MVSRGLMLKFAQIMEHLFYDGKKNGEGNFRIITMMADGNLESNWAKSSLVPFQFAEYLFCQYDNDS